MAAAHKLDASHLSAFHQVLYIQVFARINGGFHHHINLAALLLCVAQAFKLVNRGRHGYCARGMLARLEGSERLLVVIQNGCDDVDRVDLLGSAHIVEIREPHGFLDPQFLARFAQRFRAALANCNLSDIRVFLVKLDKFLAKIHSDYSNINFFHKSHPYSNKN